MTSGEKADQQMRALTREKDRGPTKQGAIQAVVGSDPLAFSIARGVSALIDATPLTLDELQSMLRNKLKLAAEAERRSRWFGGRWYNHLAGEDPDAIILSGQHLKQLFEATGSLDMDHLEFRAQYRLRKDIAEAALRSLA